MSKWFSCGGEHTGQSAMWTAFEYFRSIEPHRVGLMADPSAALAHDVRQAHAIAVADGYEWDPKGEYPVSVWMKLKH